MKSENILISKVIHFSTIDHDAQSEISPILKSFILIKISKSQVRMESM